MKKIIMCVSLLLVGCVDRFPHIKYSLNQTNTFSSKVLCRDMKNIASKKGLLQQIPKHADTLCYFLKEEYTKFESYTLLLGAKKMNNHIIIDIQSINMDIKPLQDEIQFLLSQKYPKYHIVFH